MATDKSDIKQAAEELIRKLHIMTLATAGEGGPWAAPVYYLFHGGGFYFFSNPRSRHISDVFQSGRAAASIHDNSEGWADIRGVQMEGRIDEPGGSVESIKACFLYVKRFSFIKELVGRDSGLEIEKLEKAFNARWYRFLPERALYMDNSIEFGFRERVDFGEQNDGAQRPGDEGGSQ